MPKRAETKQEQSERLITEDEARAGHRRGWFDEPNDPRIDT